MGSRELKKISFGVPTYLPIVLTTGRYARVARNLHQPNPPKWLTAAFCSVSILRKELRDLGFSEISPWFWTMDQPWCDLVKADEKVLDLRTNHQPVELALHNIRTLFRFRCFENLFYHPKRRDSEWLRETVGIDESLQAFARVDLVNTR